MNVNKYVKLSNLQLEYSGSYIAQGEARQTFQCSFLAQICFLTLDLHLISVSMIKHDTALFYTRVDINVHLVRQI